MAETQYSLLLPGQSDKVNSPRGTTGGGGDQSLACDGGAQAPFFGDGGSLFHGMNDLKKISKTGLWRRLTSTWHLLTSGGIEEAP
jgi:hypothetical protein